MIAARSTRGLSFFALVLVLLTTACSPAVTATPPTVPQAVTVGFPPSLRLVDEALNSCAQANPGIALFVSEIPTPALEPTEDDLVLWFGEPPEAAGFSAPLAMEEIVFIVHPENPVRSLSVEDLAGLLSGKIDSWEQLNEIDADVMVWAYPPGNEVEQIVSNELLQGDSITSQGYLAPDPSAMLDAVSSKTGAIGFLPRAWMTEDVKTIELEGGEGVDLRQPVLALTAESPQGAVRTLLSCLQSPTGRKILERRYEPWIN